MRTVVARRMTHAADVAGLVLTGQSQEALPTWQPGAHIDIQVDDGSWRQYSLCGPLSARHEYHIAVRREAVGRGGSQWLHDQAEIGTPLLVRGPRNHFELRPAPRYLFIAGGIGITPIIPMIEQCERRAAPWHLHYGGRSTDTMAFAQTLHTTHPDKVTLVPQDSAGLLDVASIFTGLDVSTGVYCCGPEPLIAAARMHSARWGGQLHVERFTNPTLASAPGTEKAITVRLARTGRTIHVPANVSILSALKAAGVLALSSCEEGVCGTCEVRVLGGIPDHRDAVLDDDDRAQSHYMMICVSRAQTGWLDLDL